MPFKDPDLIIVSGGDLFSSDYGTDSLRHFVAPIEWAHRQGIPCAVIGQSVGRFKSDEDRQLWRKVEEMASLVTLREAHSLDYLKADLGSEPKRFHVTADTAFLLEPSETAERQLMPIGDRPCVAVSISESICKWTGESYQTHEEVWMTFIRHILNHWDANVVLIPHVQERFSDDRIIATRLLRQLDFDRRVRVLAEDLSAAEFKGIIAKCEMVIAERMHAAIAGLSSGVCTVPIGYSIKAEGIVSSVFAGSGLNSDELWLPLGDFLNFGRSEHILDEIWRQRNQVKKAALACLPRVKSEAMRNFDLIERELR